MCLVMIGLQYRLWIGNGSYSEVWTMQGKVEQQMVKNNLLENRNNKLNEEVLDLKSGYAAIEERARFNMGMIKENERFYMIVTSNH